MPKLRSSILLTLLAFAQAIYPDDHWSFSQKLTVDNFKDTVQGEIDAGKTLFVRWIASEG